MSGKKAKMLRRAARQEMMSAPAREWVAHPKVETTAVNSPTSVRGMYRQLKKRDKEVARTGARVTLLPEFS